jgi:hypothetical protein
MGGSCMYRGVGGRMCAVGVLIPPHAYRRMMEGEGVRQKQVYNTLFRAGIFETDHDTVPMPTADQTKLALLANLQNVHDTANPTDWPYNLMELADRYQLTLPACLAEAQS